MQSKSILALAILFLACAPAKAADAAANLDLSGVTQVQVSGDASVIRLTASPGQEHRVTASAVRTGWFGRWWLSSWFYEDCRSQTRMWLDGDKLMLDAGSAWSFGPGECRVEFTAGLPSDVSVTIDQQASDIHLSGAFAAVRLAGQAADLSFSGTASSVELRTRALRANLVFTSSAEPTTTLVDCDALDLNVRYTDATSIHYQVKASAALIDSSRPDVPDASTRLLVNANYVRATIR
ncbi:hypothetical protein LA66_02810 [Aureimonas altamirensis]|uniref:Auto-transporter adhesin head GIN domain-containing protein n=1 Tax=Aureimonas altamirensis TaxID=370622 RepID=A0A0B1Q5E4_9HYPH|nr:hypothetical protein [Aureimonas altamirensis]KHJ55599.1 hypothetical protein LA66_02810 [Aureimonas altamirensis]